MQLAINIVTLQKYFSSDNTETQKRQNKRIKNNKINEKIHLFTGRHHADYGDIGYHKLQRQ